MTDMFGFGLISFFSGICVLFSSFSRLKLDRLIKNMPTSKIRSLAMGFVEVKGNLKPIDNLLISPLSKKECVFYKFELGRLVSSGSSVHYQRVFYDEKLPRCILRDDTGGIILDPKGSEMIIEPKNKGAFKKNEKFSKEIEDILIKNNLKELEKSKNQLLYKETYIEPEEQLYILGQASREYNNSESQIILKKGKKQRFIISNKQEREILINSGRKVFINFIGGIIFVTFGFIILVAFIIGVFQK